MPGPSGPQAGGERFEALYRGSYQEIFAYVARRIDGDTETVAHAIGVAVPVLTSFVGHKKLTFRSQQ